MIARAQGGGGHRRAAGFSTTLALEELIAFLREAIAAQLQLAPRRAARRHRSPEGPRAPATRRRDGRRPADRQARRDELARRRGGRAPRARAASRPATPARSTRSRPACCSCCRPGDEIPARADGAAQALRDASRGWARCRAPATPRARSPRPGASRPTRRELPDRRDPPAPAALLGGQDRRRARLPARAPRRELRDARADRHGAPLQRALAPRGPATGSRRARRIEIECGSGTYVRSLIADLGDAYCLELRRTAIGPFEVADAVRRRPRAARAWEQPARDRARARCARASRRGARARQ